MLTVPAVLRADLERARHQTDELFRLLRPGKLYERPIPERHRFLFYVGHLEAFDWNLLWRKGLGRPSFSPELDQLFEFGIDPPEGSLPVDQPSDWPTPDETYRYVERVRRLIDEAWDEMPILQRQVAVEHRMMHAETLAYMLHQADPSVKIPGPLASAAGGDPPAEEWCEIPAGVATLGKPKDSGFGWDNEFVEHQVDVPAFRVQKYKLTNRQYLAYVEQGAPAPFFWRQHEGQWFYQGMFGEVPLPLNAPVYLTQQEAADYARWRGWSLMSEAQFHRAAYGTPEGTERSYPWGEDAPDSRYGNFDFAHWDPIEVTADPRGESAFGVRQLIGNGWEWTDTVFAPFPGFEQFSFYPNYSANFFDNQHYVMKGASPRTAAALTRRSFRNWFRSRYPYVYATVHCVENP